MQIRSLVGILPSILQVLNNMAGNWPENFFRPRLKEKNLKILQKGVLEMEKVIIDMRRNRGDANW